MATAQEITDELEGLAVHYYRPNRTAEQHTAWLSDYVADLRQFSAEAVRTACRAWRQGTATKFPLLGEIVPLARREGAPSSRPPSYQEWRPATQEEYHAMSLRDKVRECDLLGSQARDTAFREAVKEGWNRNMATAPEIFHRWMGVAAGHQSEAKRLRSKLSDYRDAA